MHGSSAAILRAIRMATQVASGVFFQRARQFRRSVCANIHIKQSDQLQGDLSKEVAYQIRAQLRDASKQLKERTGTRSAVNDTASDLAQQICDTEQWTREMLRAVAPILAQAMVEAALSEWVVLQGETRERKSTASDWLDQMGIDLPEGLSAELPGPIKTEIAEALADSFQQPFWNKIAGTTKGDVERVLRQGLREGESMQMVAEKISRIGPEYSYNRGMLIARTEAGHALNSARNMSYEQFKEDMGEAGTMLNKSWLSVLGNTTRDAHAALDGVFADENGMWNLDGIWIPWPGHYELPPHQRCNCRCSIMTEFGAPPEDQTPGQPYELPAVPEEDADVPVVSEETTAPALEPEEERDYSKWAVEDILNQSESLQAKVEAATSEAVLKAEEKIAEAEREWDRLGDELRALRLELHPITTRMLSLPEGSPERKALARQVVELSNIKSEKMKELDEQFKQIDKAKETVDTVLWGALSLPKDEQIQLPIDFLKRNTKVNQRHQARVAQKRAPRSLQRKVKEVVKKIASISREGGEPEFYRTVPVYCGKTRREKYVSVRQAGSYHPELHAMYLSEYTQRPVIAHELGHHMEALFGVQKRAREFRKMRTDRSGTQDVNMAKEFPTYGYSWSEWGNEDDFGKYAASSKLQKYRSSRSSVSPDPEVVRNAAAYTGKVYQDGSTEIISVGLERLMEDPVHFARSDPEYFKFVVGVLDGTIR